MITCSINLDYYQCYSVLIEFLFNVINSRQLSVFCPKYFNVSNLLSFPGLLV